MARIIGQIESLNRLRNELNSRRIYAFNSIGEINKFKANYESEIRNSKIAIEKEVNKEILLLEKALQASKKVLRWKTEEVSKLIKSKILENEEKIIACNCKINQNILNKLYYNSQVKILERENNRLLIRERKELSKLSSMYNVIIQDDIDKLVSLTLNKEDEILIRHRKKINELERIKVVLKDLNHLIAGAIGENLVVKEIEKLSDGFILMNDFGLNFRPPIIFNKEPILSIQIDHLLICSKGVFILETKNWSKKSILDLDLRSPVEQIRRTSFALFKILNEALKNNYIYLKPHHWGERKIQIRSVIVMINNKPKSNFKFVSIKKIDELNNYLNYLDDIYDKDEVQSLYNYISNL